MSIQTSGRETVSVEHCPECGSRTIRKKKRDRSGRGANRRYDESYQCDNCREHFDIPDTQEAVVDPSVFTLPTGFDLKMAREVRGMTVPELADRVDASAPTIYRIESGEDVNIRYIRDILRVLREAGAE